MTTPAVDFDSPWKEALGEYLADALALFFPLIHAEINWGCPPEFLEAELQQVMRGVVLGRQVADKLVRVWLVSGEDDPQAGTPVLLHVEVQSQEEGIFPQRMYIDRTGV